MLLVTRSFPGSPISTWLSRLSSTRCTISSLVSLRGLDDYIPYLLYTGLVKTHFYGIWVQQKILRVNHELDVFHKLLADVSSLLRSRAMLTDMK